MIKRFKLGAVDWTVKRDDKRLNDLGLCGLCEYQKALISINKESMNSQVMEETIYHEVVHGILNTINRHDLAEDENFVQNFAVLLHQFETTKK